MPKKASPAGENTASPARRALTGGKKVSVMGLTTGPVVAACVMVGGAVLAAGWGLTHLADAGHAAAEPPVSAPSPKPSSSTSQAAGTVTLEDSDGDGVPDAYSTPTPAPSPTTETPSPAASSSTPTTAPATTRIIQKGDTLAKISAETGVPLDVLVELNHIKDPNMIFDGATLILVPAQ